MNRSFERYSFQAQCYVKRCQEDGVEPDPDHLALYMDERSDALAREANPEWQKNNLEYDLRSAQWICDKVKASEAYAQNVYAAMCNQSWQRNDVWPLLQNQRYSCSWRYAGGIVADMREQGDYIDWYCTGIRGGATQEELDQMTAEQRQKYDWYQTHFVGEGTVTDEVRADFFRLGWIPYNEDLSDDL